MYYTLNIMWYIVLHHHHLHLSPSSTFISIINIIIIIIIITIINHNISFLSYWLGSQNLPNPLYQYRIILPFTDDKVVNVATDLDFNVEGEIRYPIISNKIQAKTNFQVDE